MGKNKKRLASVLLACGLCWLFLSAEIGFTLRYALHNFPQLQVTGYRTVTNTDTGCFIRPGWVVRNPDGSLFFEGSQGAAVMSLLYICGN